MKNGFLLITILWVLLAVSDSSAQEFYLNKTIEGEPLGKVLDLIELETGYRFSYSSTAISTAWEVSVILSDSTIEQVLDKILEGTNVGYELKGMRVILKQSLVGQTVRGTIIDSQTQVPILGATVIILGSNPLKGDASDANGNFRIEHVRSGRYTFKASYLGYKDELIPGVLVGSGQEVILEIEMTESFQQLGEITVGTSSINSAPINEMAQISGRSFTVEETKRFPVSVGDPLRLVSSFAGVLATDDGGNDIVVRGNSPRGLLWVLEGVEIPSPNHFSTEGASTGAISMFSTQVISRSDFLTSAFPAQYGNATAGVFDIQLRNGNNEQRETTFQFGLLGLDVASEGPLGKKSGSSYLFNYRYSTFAMLNGVGLPLMEEGEANIFQDLSFKINMPTKKAGTFSLFGLSGLSNYRYNFGEESDNEVYNMGVVGLTNKLILNKSTVLKSTISWSHTEVADQYEAPDSESIDEVYKDETSFKKSFYRGSVELSKKVSAQHFVSAGFTGSYLGYDFQSDYQIPQNEPPYDDYEEFNDKGSSGSAQGFITWKYRMAENLTLVNGIHFLHFFLSQETVVEPRSNIRWQFSPKYAVFAGFGSHSRIESLEYYFANKVLEDGSTIDYNNKLGVTRSNHFVTGFDANLTSKIYTKVEAYYQNLYNIPVLSNEVYPDNAHSGAFSTINVTDGYVVENLVNGGSGYNYGMELTVEQKFSQGYFFLLNGMLYESKYKGRDGITRNTRYNGNFGYNALVGKEFKIDKGANSNILGLNIKITHAGNKRYTPFNLELSREAGRGIINVEDIYTERFNDYFRFDVQINYRKNLVGKTVEWRLDIQNLTSHNNQLDVFYDPNHNQVVIPEEKIFIPVLSYRIEF